MEWFLNDIHQIWLNFEIWVMYGGVFTVSVTIFLMGLLKKLCFNKMQNKPLRKTLLAVFSVILVAPVTAVYLVLNTANGLEYFWYLYALNAFGTILVYWGYENFHIRELYGMGEKFVKMLLKLIFCKHSKGTIEQTANSIREDAKKFVKSVNFFDDDLKNL